jgi:dTDP-4-amino-4,6-dideoxygalactose transaminase
VTDDVSGRLIRLPFFNDLGRRDLQRVVSVFLEAAERS